MGLQSGASLDSRVVHKFHPKETCYGKREGVVSGCAIVSTKDSRSQILQTKGWKSGCVLGIDMLGRSEMWKPDVAWIAAFKSIQQSQS